ncbi:MAG TPA: SDR family NAD(P)-dependent oxidoreductase, partial [Epsilonproteobacteria bacterium]|nr:SDR family NAD(P)-dependent oxidoreductase [Campylobacterota bacterium]
LENNPHFFFFPYDLSDTFMIKSTIKEFIEHRPFEIAILNAGVLGEIDTLSEIETSHIKDVMDINVWANKELIDLLTQNTIVQQVVGISSGAAVNGSKGWGAYSLSKSALNMLLKVYAQELPETHFTSLAPGIIETPMVKHIIEEVNETRFPSAKTLKESYIQSPKEAAQNLLKIFPKLLEHESGSFLDVRTMD